MLLTRKCRPTRSTSFSTLCDGLRSGWLRRLPTTSAAGTIRIRGGGRRDKARAIHRHTCRPPNLLMSCIFLLFSLDSPSLGTATSRLNIAHVQCSTFRALPMWHVTVAVGRSCDGEPLPPPIQTVYNEGGRDGKMAGRAMEYADRAGCASRAGPTGPLCFDHASRRAAQKGDEGGGTKR